jgi:NAD-dependent deacetylase
MKTPYENPESHTSQTNSVSHVAKLLSTAQQVTILTGAGISVESGIPAFRDGSTGLWSNVDPMEVASIEGYRRNPDRVWNWHEEMRQRFGAARPNPGHTAIADLERLIKPATLTVVTQNIDGLHQAAGSSSVVDLHGNARYMRCNRNCGFKTTWNSREDAREPCPFCKGEMRPDVIWFGEPLDELLYLISLRAASADVFFSVGTSSTIQPAASLAQTAVDKGARLVEINPYETPLSALCEIKIRASASTFFPALCDAISSRNR